MRRLRHVMLLAIALAVPACALGRRGPPDARSLEQQVMETERSFARTMADRDLAAFASFIAEEAVFFAGESPLRGRHAIVDSWRPFFEGPDAPFAWTPDRVEVLESGALALSTGPVHDESGNVIGRFNSVWRRQPTGEWLVVFDKGSPVCPETAP